MPRWITNLQGGSSSSRQAADTDSYLPANTSQRLHDAQIIRHPGTRFVDIVGEDESTSYITAQLLDGTVDQFKSVNSPVNRKAKDLSPYDVAKQRADYSINSNKEAFSWEVGKGVQIIYLFGKKYDLASVLGADKTLRAGYMNTATSVTLLCMLEDGSFNIAQVNVSNLTVVYQTIELAYTVNKGRDETDVKHLYSAFIASDLLVTVELQAATSTLKLYQKGGGGWYFLQDVDTLETVSANSTLDIHRTAASIGSAAGASGLLNADISSTNISSGNTVQDHTTLTGKRIVAVKARLGAIAILVETVDTACNKDVDMTPYASGYRLWQYFHPIIVMGFRVGNAYDWMVSTTAYDSGRQLESWDRHSSPTYQSFLYEIKRTQSGNQTSFQVQRTERPSFSGGSFTSNTSFYYRFAGKSYKTSMLNSPIPVDVASVAISLRATEYSENKYHWDRTWTNCIRFYAADPLEDTYMYFRANGNLQKDFLTYNADAVYHPSNDDLNTQDTLTGTMEIVVRKGSQETVVLSRELSAEVGISSVNRCDTNFEPHMVYYTQPQPATLGEMRDFSDTDNVKINKSINICFSGRYAARDLAKNGFFVDLKDDFDIPSFDYPNLSSDARYTYIHEGSIVFAAGPAFVTTQFFESWRTSVNKNSNPATPFNPDDPLDLEYRNFEDRHRRVNHPNANSRDVELAEKDIPPEWPDIRGWGDFRRRGGFKTWTEALLNVFVVRKAATSPNDPPQYETITSTKQDEPPITVMVDF